MLFDFGKEITAFFDLVVEFSDTFIDELRTSMEKFGFVLEKLVSNPGIQRVFRIADPFFGQDQNIVIAHKISPYAEFRPLVVIDVAIPCVTAEQNNHFASGYFPADNFRQLAQVALFVLRQVCERFFHNHKVSKIIGDPSGSIFKSCWKFHASGYLCV